MFESESSPPTPAAAAPVPIAAPPKGKAKRAATAKAAPKGKKRAAAAPKVAAPKGGKRKRAAPAEEEDDAGPDAKKARVEDVDAAAHAEEVMALIAWGWELGRLDEWDGANIRIVHPIDRLALRGPLLPGHATRPGSTRLAGVKHRVGK